MKAKPIPVGEMRRLLERWFWHVNVYVAYENTPRVRKISVIVAGNDLYNFGQAKGAVSRRLTSRARVIKAVSKIVREAYCNRVLLADLPPPPPPEPWPPEVIEKRRAIIHGMASWRGS